MTVPVSSTFDHRARAFLDGPYRLAPRTDQQSDLLRVDMRGQESRRPRRDVGPWTRDGREHLTEDLNPGLARLAERFADDLLADAGNLQIKLDPGHAVLSAGHLEIHVAEMVLIADDVGQQNPAVLLLYQADGDAGHRIRDRHARRHQPEVAPQTLAIELEPFDSRMSEMMRIV